MNVKVKIVKEGDQIDSYSYLTVPFTAMTDTDSHGEWKTLFDFELPDPNAKYYVYVKGPKHIQKKFCDANPQINAQKFYSCSKANITFQKGKNNFLDFSNIKLLAGDLPEQGSVQNGIIDSYDIGIMRQYSPPFCDIEGKKQNCTEAEIYAFKKPALPICDINLDNKIDGQDWSAILASMAVKYDEK